MTVMRPRARDRVAVWLFIALWLIPVGYRGAMHRAPPLLPKPLARLSNISCLFSKAMPTWRVFYVQYRDRPGGPWQELDTSRWFRLEPFGHRTRLTRYLENWPARGDAARAELAAWLADAYQAELPDRPTPHEIRFLRARIGVRDDAPPTGCWERPPLREVPANHLDVMSTHRLETRP